jgi:hypothetical protein
LIASPASPPRSAGFSLQNCRASRSYREGRKSHPESCRISTF